MAPISAKGQTACARSPQAHVTLGRNRNTGRLAGIETLGTYGKGLQASLAINRLVGGLTHF